MLEHGSLAVLSLDSMMAVRLTRSYGVLTGDSVTLTLPDGTEISGRVESNLNNELVITVEDEGYSIGEKVTLAKADGTVIDSGELYVHNAWYATAFTGTISTVSANVDREVSSGSTLFTLTDTDFTAQYKYLSSRHREYEELMQELFQMHETGTINAPCDGVISGVDKESTHLLSAEDEQRQTELLNAETESGTTENGWKIVFLSSTAVTCIPGEDCPLDSGSAEHQETCVKACDRHAGCDANTHYDDCITHCISSDEGVPCNLIRFLAK